MTAKLITPFSPASASDAPPEHVSLPETPAAAPATPPPAAPASDASSLPNSQNNSITELIHAPAVFDPGDEVAEAPEPETPAAETPADFSFDDEPDAFGFDDEQEPDARTQGQTNEDRAARRIAAKEAARLARENEELRQKNEALAANQITDADVQLYQDARRQAERARVLELELRYDRAYSQAVAQAKRAGEEIPDYDENVRNQWVNAQMQAAQKPITAQDVRGVVTEVISDFQARSQQEFTQAQQAKQTADRKAAWKKEMQEAAAKDKTGALRRMGREIVAHAEKVGYAEPASKYIAKVLGPQKKAAGVRPGDRAAAARAAVPLSRGGGAREPASAGLSRQQQIERENLDIAGLMAKHRAGKLANPR